MCEDTSATKLHAELKQKKLLISTVSVDQAPSLDSTRSPRYTAFFQILYPVIQVSQPSDHVAGFGYRESAESRMFGFKSPEPTTRPKSMNKHTVKHIQHPSCFLLIEPVHVQEPA